MPPTLPHASGRWLRPARALALALLTPAVVHQSTGPLLAADPAGPDANGPVVDRPVADGPNVAVLVHGFQGLLPWSRGYRCADGIVGYDEAGPPDGRAPRAAGEFGVLAQALARRGYDIYFARWTTSGSQTVGVREAGACLADQIAEARRRAAVRAGKPALRVTVVAHSMGGLASRAYIEGGAYPPRDDVARLVTFGSPHGGVASDVLLRLFALLNPAAIARGLLPCAASPGICDLSREAMTAFNRAHQPRGGVGYDLVAGDKPILLTSWFVPGADDGVVETKSALGLAAPRWIVNDSHASLSGIAGDHFMNSGESAACLESLLGATPGARCGRPAQARAGAAGGPPGRWTFTPVVADRVEAGQTQSYSLHLDGEEARVAIGGIVEGMSATLRAPDGTVHHPTAMGALDGAGRDPADPADASETSFPAGPGVAGGAGVAGDEDVPADPTFDPLAGAPSEPDAVAPRPAPGARPLAFRLSRPIAGSWTLEVRNPGPAPADIAYFAALDSPIELAVVAPAEDAPAAAPGTAVRVEAWLADGGLGRGGARVVAWMGEGDAVRRVDLADRGGGRYAADLDVPPVAGLHHLVVVAEGIGPDGARFTRAAGRVLAAGSRD